MARSTTKSRPVKADQLQPAAKIDLHPTKKEDQVIQQDQIADQMREAEKDAAKVKTLLEMIADKRSKYAEVQTIEDLTEQLAQARERLKQKELDDKELNDMKDNLASRRNDARVSREVLSQLLVTYMAKYQHKSIVVFGEMHEIKVTAKVGKELDRQEALPL